MPQSNPVSRHGTLLLITISLTSYAALSIVAKPLGTLPSQLQASLSPQAVSDLTPSSEGNRGGAMRERPSCLEAGCGLNVGLVRGGRY